MEPPTLAQLRTAIAERDEVIRDLLFLYSVTRRSEMSPADLKIVVEALQIYAVVEPLAGAIARQLGGSSPEV